MTPSRWQQGPGPYRLRSGTGRHGQEGEILRFVFWHSLILAVLMGLLVMAQAYWLRAMIP